MAFNESSQNKVGQACSAGQEFSKVFYDTLDKKRHLLSKLYMDTAEAVWNGNHMKGREAIIKFYEDLPMSEHKVESLDCQPLAGQITGDQLSIVVKTYGSVKFTNNAVKAMHQTFMLTSQNNVWKIFSDNLRFQDKSDN